jgi:hypothetical protein
MIPDIQFGRRAPVREELSHGFEGAIVRSTIVSFLLTWLPCIGFANILFGSDGD